MKTCAKCGEKKQQSEFHKSSKAKDGLCSYCKVCAKRTVDLWKAENPDRRKLNQANHFQKHKSAYNEKRKERRAKFPDETKALQAKFAKKHRLKSKYGLTSSDVEAMIARQNNRCAICEVEFSTAKKPVIDHCHSTGVVRNILCSPCNTALGHIEKDGFFRSAIEYLALHGKHIGNS